MLNGSVRLEWRRAYDQPWPRGRLYPGRARKSAPVRMLWGDNLDVLEHEKASLHNAVMLAYLDPPFFTGKAQLGVVRQRDAKTGEMVRHTLPAFDDRWHGFGQYLDSLAPRLERVFATLHPRGSLLVHVDPRTSHYVKLLCDELFGAEHFASEVIWRYRRWPAKTKNFQKVHDVILRYVKDVSVEPCFNQLYEPLAPSTLATWGTRKQQAVVDSNGRRRRSQTTKSESPGAALGDVWDIGIVAPVSRERTGYPTQKPEALLERLVLALTEPGDLVLDPFAGSGTTLIVAARLGRKALGIDESPVAEQVARARFDAEKIPYTEQRFERLAAKDVAPKASARGTLLNVDHAARLDSTCRGARARVALRG